MELQHSKYSGLKNISLLSMHLTRDEQSNFGLGLSFRREICGDATPASPSFAHRVPATTHRRVPTERVLSSPHESRGVPSLLHYSDDNTG